MEDRRKETYEEKLEHLKRLSGWKEKDCKSLITLIYRYLDSSGYFMSDYNIHGFTRPDNWINYIDRDFGRWLLDMALQYNMEQGKEYFCRLIGDRTKQEYDKRYYDEDMITKEDVL